MNGPCALAAGLALLFAAPPRLQAAEIPSSEAVPGQHEINVSSEFAYHYKQTHYQLEDMQGDVSLTALSGGALPILVKHVLLGEPVLDYQLHDESLNPVLPDPPLQPPPTEAEIRALPLADEEKDQRIVELRNSQLVIEGRKNPLSAERAARMLTQIIAEEFRGGIVPRYGTPHRWTAEFRRRWEADPKRNPYGVGSKLLLALMRAVTWRFLVTDQEKNLLAYILSREDSSVTIHELFRQSYRLNDGDVYLTLLTIENVLCEYWKSPDRERRATTRKLSSITNTHNGRDKFGAWYHLFGIMLLGYAEGDFARLVAMVETEGARILSGGKNQKQKAWINNRGAALGVALRYIVLMEDYKKFPLGSVDAVDPKKYLDLTEDFRDRLEIVESRDLGVSLYGNVLSIESSARDYRACRLDVIPDLGQGFNSEFLTSFPSLTFARGAVVAARLPYDPPPRAVRVFLENCVEGAGASKTATNAPARTAGVLTAPKNAGSN